MSVNPIRDLEPPVTTVSNQLMFAINPKTASVDDFESIGFKAVEPACQALLSTRG
jgi:hypothetical protein